MEDKALYPLLVTIIDDYGLHRESCTTPSLYVVILFIYFSQHLQIGGLALSLGQ